MKRDAVRAMPRRNFLKLAGAAGVCGLSQTGFAAAAKRVLSDCRSGEFDSSERTGDESHCSTG